MSLLDHFTPEEIAAELRRLGYTVTPPSLPSWLVVDEDDDEVRMLGRGADDV